MQEFFWSHIKQLQISLPQKYLRWYPYWETSSTSTQNTIHNTYPKIKSKIFKNTCSRKLPKKIEYQTTFFCLPLPRNIQYFVPPLTLKKKDKKSPLPITTPYLFSTLSKIHFLHILITTLSNTNLPSPSITYDF